MATPLFIGLAAAGGATLLAHWYLPRARGTLSAACSLALVFLWAWAACSSVLASPPDALLWLLLLLPPAAVIFCVWKRWVRPLLHGGPDAVAAHDADMGRACLGGSCAAPIGALMLQVPLVPLAVFLCFDSAAIQRVVDAGSRRPPSSSQQQSCEDAPADPTSSLLAALPVDGRALLFAALLSYVVAGAVEESMKAAVALSPWCCWAMPPPAPPVAGAVAPVATTSAAPEQIQTASASGSAAAAPASGAVSAPVIPQTPLDEGTSAAVHDAVYNTVLRLALAGIGFATLENVGYVFAAGMRPLSPPGCEQPNDGGSVLLERALTAAGRAVLSLPVHAVCAAFTGLRAAVRNAQLRALPPPQARVVGEGGGAAATAAPSAWGSAWSWPTVLWPAVVVHGTFNFTQFAAALLGWGPAVGLALPAVVAASAAWALTSQLRATVSILAAGTLPSSPVAVTCAPACIPAPVRQLCGVRMSTGRDGNSARGSTPPAQLEAVTAQALELAESAPQPALPDAIISMPSPLVSTVLSEERCKSQEKHAEKADEESAGLLAAP